MNSPTYTQPNELSLLTVLSIYFGASAIAIAFFQWILVELLTPFLLAPLLFCLLGGIGLLVIASIIYLTLNLQNPRRAVQPLLVNVVTALIFIFTPFTEIWLAIELSSNLKGYNEVVQLVEQGQLQPDDGGVVRLPQGYRHLSRGGDIRVDTSDGTLSVFFFTFRGILDNYSGFMYRADGTPPSNRSALGDWVQVVRKRPHWYFCASH